MTATATTTATAAHTERPLAPASASFTAASSSSVAASSCVSDSATSAVQQPRFAVALDLFDALPVQTRRWYRDDRTRRPRCAGATAATLRARPRRSDSTPAASTNPVAVILRLFRSYCAAARRAARARRRSAVRQCRGDVAPARPPSQNRPRATAPVQSTAAACRDAPAGRTERNRRNAPAE